MQVIRSLRWLLLALLLSLVSTSANAGVFISVGFAPPPLPVYEQPPCPEPGLMWTPGYWAYGDDGYYWVPGAWVPAPEPNFLWTPPYWGWENGLYLFHRGYWGPHVGFYGGVNYGFGYGGIGFAGGEWRHGHFAYNTAVVHVDRRYVHETFEDRGRVDRGYVSRGNHVAFSGGPGGIRHDPRPEERQAEHEHHMDVTSFQHSHEDAARGDRGSYVKNNNGRPAHLAADRPLGSEMHSPAQAPNGFHRDERNNSDHGNGNQPGRSQSSHDNRNAPESKPQFTPQQHPENRDRGNSQHDSHSNGMNGQAPQNHPAPQFRQAPQPNPAHQEHAPAQQFHPAPQPHSAPQRDAAPPQHSAPAQHSEPSKDRRDDHKEHR